MILAGFPIASVTSVPACPSCGDRCNDCGDRMCAEYGPAPAPRCPEHPTCEDCADARVYCPDCREQIRAAAEDRAEQTAYDIARERS